ncbi:MAG TPA: hypothetical protein VD906_14715, partial [Caulobacteraceae bacterium]|nr:hypothetical protein [Caulobacteraceae bacterium]
YRGKQLEPTWPEHGLHLNLACYLQSGHQLRVAWFDHGRVEAFAPAAQVGGAASTPSRPN